MKVFHCDHCGHLLFFENTLCIRCGQLVAYLPDLADIGSLEADGGRTDIWRSPLQAAAGRTYRLCSNYAHERVCNWAVAAEDPNPLCVSCRLTRVIPDLSESKNREAWYRLEVAKRRLIFTLLQLKLPIVSRADDPVRGLAFEFKADTPHDEATTGHETGVITINLAEADDAERERRRTSLAEPYRTLAGHLRHESGHYYWDRLIGDGGAADGFRQIFGDERSDYRGALEAYYAQGPQPDWQGRFISAYASAHPLEDWAETWSHYLHIVDTVETAAECGLSLQPRRPEEPSLSQSSPGVLSRNEPFDRLIDSWFSIVYVLNHLNRGLGLADAYPFVWPDVAIDKLRYIHEVVQRVRT